MLANRVHPQISPWKVWNQLHSELNDFWGSNTFTPAIPLNLWTQDDAATLVAEMPGRKPEDFQVSAQRDVLSIEVDASADERPENAKTVREERKNSRVTRQIRLPFEVDPETIEATYERGLLQINLSRHVATMPVKVTVKAG